jgi:hypothetical protein
MSAQHFFKRLMLFGCFSCLLVTQPMATAVASEQQQGNTIPLPVPALEQAPQKAPTGKTVGSLRSTTEYQAYRDLLHKAVLQTGTPERFNYSSDVPQTGTRVKDVVRRSSFDGSRFLYEAFVRYPELLPELRQLRDSFVAIANSGRLVTLSDDEQLAYWLNLHNLLVIDMLAHRYPLKHLQALYQGEQAWLHQPLIMVAGSSLSLADIKFGKVLPLAKGRTEVIYGFYEGYISAPSIRSEPFDGRNLAKALQDNAVEFINTSRGSYPEYGTSFRVATFYQRHQAFFPFYPADLKPHLLKYLASAEHAVLAKVEQIDVDINDWRIADLYGTVRSGIDMTQGAGLELDSRVVQSIRNKVKSKLVLSDKQKYQLKMLQRRQRVADGNVEIIDLPAEPVATTTK